VFKPEGPGIKVVNKGKMGVDVTDGVNKVKLGLRNGVSLLE